MTSLNIWNRTMDFLSNPIVCLPIQNHVIQESEIHLPDQIFEKTRSHTIVSKTPNVTKTFTTQNENPLAVYTMKNGRIPTNTTSHQKRNVRENHRGGETLGLKNWYDAYVSTIPPTTAKVKRDTAMMISLLFTIHAP